jgi:tRNA pseudouridine38-40 synthase
MAGTHISVAQGRIEPDSITEIIESRSRDRAGMTAAACGLYLNKVIY